MFNTTNAIGFLLTAANKAHEAELDKKVRHLGVTAVQGAIMDQLYQHEGISQKELARYCQKDPSSLTKILDILSKKELIVRQPNKEDRRAFKLYLTAKGTEVHQACVPIAEAHNKTMVEGIMPEDLEITKAVLRKIVRNMQETEV